MEESNKFEYTTIFTRDLSSKAFIYIPVTISLCACPQCGKEMEVTHGLYEKKFVHHSECYVCDYELFEIVEECEICQGGLNETQNQSERGCL